LLFFPYIGNVIIPTDELHDFSEGYKYTTNQACYVKRKNGFCGSQAMGQKSRGFQNF
jgi:hypothetical protein